LKGYLISGLTSLMTFNEASRKGQNLNYFFLQVRGQSSGRQTFLKIQVQS